MNLPLTTKGAPVEFVCQEQERQLWWHRPEKAIIIEDYLKVRLVKQLSTVSSVTLLEIVFSYCGRARWCRGEARVAGHSGLRSPWCAIVDSVVRVTYRRNRPRKEKSKVHNSRFTLASSCWCFLLLLSSLSSFPTLYSTDQQKCSKLSKGERTTSQRRQQLPLSQSSASSEKSKAHFAQYTSQTFDTWLGTGTYITSSDAFLTSDPLFLLCEAIDRIDAIRPTCPAISHLMMSQLLCMYLECTRAQVDLLAWSHTSATLCPHKHSSVLLTRSKKKEYIRINGGHFHT